MVDVGQVGSYAQEACYDEYARSLEPRHHLVAHNGIDSVGQYQEGHDEEEVVRHLHVVAHHLEGCK